MGALLHTDKSLLYDIKPTVLRALANSGIKAVALLPNEQFATGRGRSWPWAAWSASRQASWEPSAEQLAAHASMDWGIICNQGRRRQGVPDGGAVLFLTARSSSPCWSSSY